MPSLSFYKRYGHLHDFVELLKEGKGLILSIEPCSCETKIISVQELFHYRSYHLNISIEYNHDYGDCMVIRDRSSNLIRVFKYQDQLDKFVKDFVKKRLETCRSKKFYHAYLHIIENAKDIGFTPTKKQLDIARSIKKRLIKEEIKSHTRSLKKLNATLEEIEE